MKRSKPAMSFQSKRILNYLEMIGGSYVGSIHGIKDVVVTSKRIVLIALQDLVADGYIEVHNAPERVLDDKRRATADIARIQVLHPENKV